MFGKSTCTYCTDLALWAVLRAIVGRGGGPEEENAGILHKRS